MYSRILFIVCLCFVMMPLQEKDRPSSEELFRKAQHFISQNQPHLAMKTLEKIPRDDPKWGEKAYQELQHLLKEEEAGDAAINVRRAMENYANNIELFIWRYIDAPQDKPEWVEKIRRDYASDRKSYLRVLLVRRIPFYLENHPEGRDREEVLALQKKYSKEADVKKTPSFRDIEVEADTELTLRHWGEAYKVIDAWQRKAPEAERKKQRHRIDDLLDRTWAALQKDWMRMKENAERRASDGNYLGSNRIYRRFLELSEGYDDAKAKKIRAYWQEKYDENEAAVEAMTGGI